MILPPSKLSDTPLPLDFYARQRGASRTTMWRYRKAGLPAVGVGDRMFVRESDFDAFVARMRKAGSAPAVSAPTPEAPHE